MAIRIVPASGLEKIFLDSAPSFTYKGGSLLSNENYSFQFAYTGTMSGDWGSWAFADVKIESDIADNLELYTVENVPVTLSAFGHHDHGYLRHTPGLYPDPLRPLCPDGQVKILSERWQSIWVRVKGDVAPGKHIVRLTLSSEKAKGIASAEVELNVLAAKLPEQELIYTNWFHCDCVADLHHKEIFSDEYWTVMEKHMKLYGENGINMILVPAFTPPLDTPVGAERMTAQLVGVTKEGEKYTFDFTLFDKYIASAQKYGIKWFEHSHFFTQWGVEHAPKVMATVDSEYKRIFGWDSDATGPEYSDFLHQYLDALVPHLKELGIDDKFYYHISDEPGEAHLDNYRKAKAVVYDQLKDYHFFDALSHVEFYKAGLTSTPVAVTSTVTDFVGVADDLWTYYTGGQSFGLSNRLISMASRRNRVIGMQMYKNNIKGFLHWGFNFYYTTLCREVFDPYVSADAHGEFPGGTCFQVYPRGEAVDPSLRLFVFHDCIQDIRAMKLLESAIGHDAVVALMESVGGRIDWMNCPGSDEQFLAVREAVNAEIAKYFC